MKCSWRHSLSPTDVFYTFWLCYIVARHRLRKRQGIWIFDIPDRPCHFILCREVLRYEFLQKNKRSDALWIFEIYQESFYLKGFRLDKSWRYNFYRHSSGGQQIQAFSKGGSRLTSLFTEFFKIILDYILSPSKETVDYYSCPPKFQNNF